MKKNLFKLLKYKTSILQVITPHQERNAFRADGLNNILSNDVYRRVLLQEINTHSISYTKFYENHLEKGLKDIAKHLQNKKHPNSLCYNDLINLYHAVKKWLDEDPVEILKWISEDSNTKKKMNRILKHV